MVNKNELIIEKLNTIYSRAMRLEDLKHFLLSVYEYIGFFDSTPSLEPVYKSIKELSEKEHEPLKDLEAKALKEIEIAYKGVKKYIVDEKIDNAVVLDALSAYECSVAGTYWSSLGILGERYSTLTYTLMNLVESYKAKHLKFCQKYGTIEDGGRIISWDFSPNYDAWEKANDKLKKTELATVWYSWDKLVSFYTIYKDYEELQDKYIKERRIWVTYGLSMMNDEIKSIMEGGDSRIKNHKEYSLIDYKIHLERVHSHTKEFLLVLNDGATPSELLSWSYERSTGVLEIKGKSISFKQENFPAKVLEVLTKNDKNKRKKWNCSEIYEVIEGVEVFVPKVQARKVYDTGKNINKRLAEVAHFSDFLLVSTATIQINPKYL